MSRPKKVEVFFAYITVASHAVSLVLVRVKNGVQQPIYYVSKSLHETEIRYLPLESHFGNGVCYAKAPPLFSSSHSYAFNSTLSVVVAPKSLLYRENCQVGNNFGGI